MFRFSFSILLICVLLSSLQYTQAKGGHSSSHHSSSHHSSSHSSSHSYPSSHGLSGGGHNSGGLSGGHGYPSSGGSHSYPSSHSMSGSHSSSSSSQVHHHYHYSPPPRITYTHTYGGAPIAYPVYVGQPPTYVYEYRDSGSVYGSLLAGLALYNLGSVNAHRHSNYQSQPGEVCKLGVKKSNGDYDETRIKCEIITSFIFEEEKANTQVTNSTFTSTTVTNTTSTNVTNGQPNTLETTTTVNSTYTLLPNGTLIPQVTSLNVTNDNGTITSMKDTVTVTTTNTTVINAVDVKGKEIEVTPQMQCYVMRDTSISHMKKSLPCGILQSYANQSLRRNSATRFAPAVTLLFSVFLLVITH